MFPYYAGFPEPFAENIIESSGLSKESLIYDPWNGSGTTTYIAAKLGYNTCGLDLNPVMVIVAKARALASTEADSIEPQAKSLLNGLERLRGGMDENDPLLQWFSLGGANIIRHLESRVRTRLVSQNSLSHDNSFNKISCFAAIFYLALFGLCRDLTRQFRSSNPTWLKPAKSSAEKIEITYSEVGALFLRQIEYLTKSVVGVPREAIATSKTDILVGNTVSFSKRAFADMVLTSPPYCTRIDYTAATRVELAVIYPLLDVSRDVLSQEMIGSIRVPNCHVEPREEWGETCNIFLKNLASHNSKASSGYYYKTHADYYDKMYKSINNISNSLKAGGAAILVVQDSYYKDIHNNVPLMLTQMAESSGLKLVRQEDFLQNHTMAAINPKVKTYRESSRAMESVLCFQKQT